MMDVREYRYEEFDKIFHPEHIAFVGASEKSTFGSMLYLIPFKDSQWAKTFYPVNPHYDRIFEWKCYPSILEIPFPVDTAYLSVKAPVVPEVLHECVEKGVSWVIVYSSGFSETGELEGLALENSLTSIINGTNTRIIGPNCLGPYNGETGMAFSFNAPKGIPGGISFMSQSGGHLNQLLDISYKRDLRLRYGVSFGNQIDLNCMDFLRHFKIDDKTTLIAAYLESFGSAHGHQFFKEVKETSKLKPVVIWKGGYTNAGSQAAFSHTGALGTDFRLWKSMAIQCGAILVDDNEEFWNIIKTFELIYPKLSPKGRRVGIITPGGGSSVNATDLFASNGLFIPELSDDSQEKIKEILPKENVNIKNPVDLGALGFVIDVFIKCIEIVANDNNIDIIIIPLWPHFLFSYVFKRMYKILKQLKKPYALCLPSLADSIDLTKRFSIIKKVLHDNRMLYYFSMRDAASCFAKLCNYIEYRRSHGIT
jgi:acyl-CoA synthetase (NDP forming)